MTNDIKRNAFRLIRGFNTNAIVLQMISFGFIIAAFSFILTPYPLLRNTLFFFFISNAILLLLINFLFVLEPIPIRIGISDEGIYFDNTKHIRHINNNIIKGLTRVNDTYYTIKTNIFPWRTGIVLNSIAAEYINNRIDNKDHDIITEKIDWQQNNYTSKTSIGIIPILFIVLSISTLGYGVIFQNLILLIPSFIQFGFALGIVRYDKILKSYKTPMKIGISNTSILLYNQNHDIIKIPLKTIISLSTTDKICNIITSSNKYAINISSNLKTHLVIHSELNNGV